MREKVGKSRNTVFFQWFGAPEGSLKQRVRSQLARWEMKNCTPLWREAHLEVKCVKYWGVRTTFGSWDVEKSARRCGAKHMSKSKCTKHTSVGPLLEVAMSEKVHAVVARSTFPSQNVQNTPLSDHFWKWDVEKVHAVVARSTFPSENVQNTPGPDHFWKLRCRKSARRCGAKHISNSKCTKHTRFGPLLEVAMSKKVYAVVARSTFRIQNVQNTPGPDHFWKLRCRKSARGCGAKHMSKSTCTKHHMFAPLLEVQMSLRFTTLHYTTLHSTTLHYTTLHDSTLQLHNYTPLHSTTLHYTK